MTGAAQPSYSHGASDIPLLGETIGNNIRRIAAAYPDREAVVDVPTGRRWTYAQFDADTDTLAQGADRGGHRGRRPGRHLVARTVRSGCCSSTPPRRPAWSW